MNRLNQLAVFVFLFFLTTPQVKADIEIEPYVGVYAATGKTSLNVTTTMPASTRSASTEDKFGGIAYGLKLGWTFALLTVGADYMVMNHGTENSTNIGPAATVEIGPIAFKATYFASSSNKATNTTATGSGFKGGVGFSLIPFTSINLEYFNIAYTKIKDSELGDAVTYNSYDQKSSGVMLSLSLVF